MSFILIMVSSPFVMNDSIDNLIWIFIGLQAASCVAILFVKEQFKRRNKDAELQL